MFRKLGLPAMRDVFQDLYRRLFAKGEPVILEPAREKDEKRFDASLSSGGMKAYLGGTGFVLLLRVAGIDKLIDAVVANSGGFVPGACLKSLISTKNMLHRIIHTDVGTLLTPKTGLIRRLWAILGKQRFEITLPKKGVYSTRSYEDFITEALSERGSLPWPERFMTVTTVKSGHLVAIACNGVYKYMNGMRIKLSDRPPSIGEAAAAAAAIPGIIDSKNLFGEFMFDGVLTGDGRCQIKPLKQHYGDRGMKLIVFDVGEDGIKKRFWLRLLWNVFALGRGGSLESAHPVESEDVIVVNCKIEGFHGLQFTLPLADKWRGIITGYLATARRLRRAGLISIKTHPAVYELAKEFRQALKYEATLAKVVENALAKRGLW